MKIAAFVLSAFALFLILRSCEADEESIIRAQLEQMRQVAELRAPEPPLNAAARAKRLADYFTADTEFEYKLSSRGVSTLESREELQQRFLAARRQLSSLELTIEDIDVNLSTEEAATVELTASALGRMPGEEGQFLEQHRILLSFVKTEGNWLIASCKHLRDLRETEE